MASILYAPARPRRQPALWEHRRRRPSPQPALGVYGAHGIFQPIAAHHHRNGQFTRSLRDGDNIHLHAGNSPAPQQQPPPKPRLSSVDAIKDLFGKLAQAVTGKPTPSPCLKRKRRREETGRAFNRLRAVCRDQGFDFPFHVFAFAL